MRSDARARISHVEGLECRMVLSSHPLGDFRLDYLTDDGTGGTGLAGAAPLYADADIQATLANVRQTYGFQGTGQTVAVIDSGIAWDHMALGEGWGPGYRVVGGWDFTGDNDAHPYDDGPFGSHGTHVAGIIGSDVAAHMGVAPDVDLVALRVFDDDGAGYLHWVEQSLDWVHENLHAFEHPITTVNLSLGTSTNSEAAPTWAILEDELAQLEADGVFVAVAAGNAFEQFQSEGLGYPASSQFVVPVMAADPSGDLSYFSQRHERAIAARGRWITSSVPDYVGNQNGRQDDFATYSGTSMATPYVAGASVLVREAMNFLGLADIDQDDIQTILMDSADPVYDAATDRIYRHLDLSAALRAVMPDDDFGSTPAEAWNMGRLSNNTTVDGLVSTLTDVDYFSFTAGVSGKVTLSADTSHDLDIAWHLPDTDYRVDKNGRISLNVELGENYVFGVSTHDGLGFFTLDVEVSGAREYTDLGVVDFVQMDHARAPGVTWYRIETMREGLLTIDAVSAESSSSAELSLHDHNLNPLFSNGTRGGRWRVDVSTGGSDVYYLRVSTPETDIDLRVSNLLNVTEDGAEVFGTPGNDVFYVGYGPELHLKINDVGYRLATSPTHALKLHGGSGLDAVSVVASAGATRASVHAGQFELKDDSGTVAGNQFEQIRLYGRGLNDDVRIYGTASADNLVMTSSHVRLAGGGYYAFVEGFPFVRVYGITGADDAFVFDSPGDDNYVAAAAHVRMAGQDYYRFAEGFELTRAFASAGHDVAFLYDSNDDDTLVSHAHHVQFSGPSFNNTVRGFDRVVAYAAGGWDNALFHINESGYDDAAESGSRHSTEFGNVEYLSGFDQTITYRAPESDSAAGQTGVPSQSGGLTARHGPSAARYGPGNNRPSALADTPYDNRSDTIEFLGPSRGVPFTVAAPSKRAPQVPDNLQTRSSDTGRYPVSQARKAAPAGSFPLMHLPDEASDRGTVPDKLSIVDVLVYDVHAAVEQGDPGPTVTLTPLDSLFEQLGRSP